MLLEAFSTSIDYFTFWNLALVALAPFLYELIDIVATSFLVFVVSSYMLFVEPGYFKAIQVHLPERVIQEKRLEWGISLACHVITHALPLLVVVVCFGSYYIAHGPFRSTLLHAILLALAYIKLVDVDRPYDISTQHVAVVGTLAFTVYAVILASCG